MSPNHFARRREQQRQQRADDDDGGPLLPEHEERVAIERAKASVYRRPAFDRSPPLEEFLRRPRWSRLPP